MREMRILSFDGGGIRGAIPAARLNQIELARPGFAASADMYAGTSIGGIMALALADGRTPVELVQLFRKGSANIFPCSWERRFESAGGLLHAKYAGAGLTAVLTEIFGDGRIGDLTKRVLIPVMRMVSYDGRLPAPRPEFVHNFPDCDDGCLDLRIVDVAMATAAAPTYFPPHVILGRGKYWDGGVCCNNPGVFAFINAYHRGFSPTVLSFGTGRRTVPIDVGDWGAAQVAVPLINALMAAQAETFDVLACTGISSESYRRINPDLDTEYALDDAHRVGELLDLGRVAPTEDELRWIDLCWWGKRTNNANPGPGRATGISLIFGPATERALPAREVDSMPQNFVEILTDTQEVVLRIQPMDGAGNPVDGAGTPRVASSDPTVITAEVSDDGQTALLSTTGKLGPCQVTASLDVPADDGGPGTTLTQTVDVEVKAGKVSSLQLTFQSPASRGTAAAKVPTATLTPAADPETVTPVAPDPASPPAVAA